jgi:hypothetical protein
MKPSQPWGAQPLCKAGIKQYRIITERSELLKRLVCLSIYLMLYLIKQYRIITERSELLKRLVCLSIYLMLYLIEPARVNLLMDEGN